MALYQAVVLSTILTVSWCAENSTFPPGFMFGAATASYQIEGGWNESDKGESIWDRYTHEHPEMMVDLSNGDVACDSYHLWKRDIRMAEELGLQFYRFSLSWPRILPTGYPNYISEDGRRYYNNLIDGLLEKGIEPFITLYHWDLPQNFQDLGGWMNPLIADWFADYARVVFNLFGDRVKWWLTLNEPTAICDGAYNSDMFAPVIKSPEVGAYLCNKNLLLAHAKAWRIYDEEFKPKYHGKVSLANLVLWFEGKTKDDDELVELARQTCAGRYAHAIFSKEGGWPPSVVKNMEKVSRERGYPRSTLPPFTKTEIELVRGTYDFFALNHYTSRLIRKAKKGETFRPWALGDAIDLNAITERRDDWGLATSSWFYLHPEGIRLNLAWLKQEYGDIEFVITENGLPTYEGLKDKTRVKFYQDNLKQILLSIYEDGVNVTGYTAWTLMDNFEWMDGYIVKFGLYEVDFSDPLRARVPRDSALYYASVIQSNSIDVRSTRWE